ncbi:hypothetical protein [Paenibacillus sacheonensis]|uniref:Uncharacterized protein n=1 Tax=Paenibacillus sacheonensis TaxID=742054 RepID=A0A7X5C043_9BACL|nr:hypothetical protein [Paenibacillus sacheonensis]MBM7567538.1 hypothetical protein [Paenibacillus sacheonensis]NBC71357.1 hypothetical protein [Paenibacillus sacheonensis]
MEEVAQGITIENVGMLDLTGKQEDDLSGVTLIQNVGLILVPQALTAALMKIAQKNVGLTVTLPEPSANGKLKVISGQVTIGGEAFANENGSADDVLVIVGQVIVTSPVAKIGFGEVHAAGQFIFPKASEAILAGGITRLAGQIVYYHKEAPRLFVGNDTFSKGFFELFDTPMSMVLVGDFEFESDVDIALLKQKVTEIVLVGSLKAPKPLVPLLQLLAVTKLGDIIGIEPADMLDAAGAE